MKNLVKEVSKIHKDMGMPKLSFEALENTSPEVLEMIVRIHRERWYSGYDKGYKDGLGDKNILATDPNGSNL